MFWTTGSGRIELNITKNDASFAGHPGSCDNEVLQLSKKPAIKRQLAKIPVDLLASELKEYGAWDEIELQDHNQNLQRLLWLACGDISEGNN